MDLNQLVEAAVAKALADYIGTRGTLDDAFLDKLAERIAQKTVEANRALEDRIRDEEQKKSHDEIRKLMEHYQRMQSGWDLYKPTIKY